MADCAETAHQEEQKYYIRTQMIPVKLRLKLAIFVLVVLVLATLLFLLDSPVAHSSAELSVNNYWITQLAGVLSAEGGVVGDDFEIMACTVRNRLLLGTSPARVRAAYHARYIRPSQAQIDTLRTILFAETVDGACRVVYFMYADWYARRWIVIDPVISVGGNSYYRYEDYPVMWKR